MSETVTALASFASALRARGIRNTSGEVLDFCRATAHLAPLDVTRLYWAARTTLLRDPSDINVFNEVFRAFFSGAESFTMSRPPAVDEEVARLIDVIEDDDGGASGHQDASGPALASRVEILRSRSFEAMTQEELVEAGRLIAAIRPVLPSRRTRRMRSAPRGRSFDARRTLRASLRTGGEPRVLHRRDRVHRYRSLVLILDVSGSMGPYARALLRFAHSAMLAGHRVEVFCFGTRLTRITPDLRLRDADLALERVGGSVADWQGGTRIGPSLRSLLVRHGQDAHLRGSVVVICSDGLDRGDPESLAVQMGRLRRLAHRIVWVNPLKGSDRYQPLARGMAACLPYIDEFVPGHNVKSLEELGRVLTSERRAR
jgi:uncharacterized protein with von Willebrand factor type A (vWA) domain